MTLLSAVSSVSEIRRHVFALKPCTEVVIVVVQLRELTPFSPRRGFRSDVYERFGALRVEIDVCE